MRYDRNMMRIERLDRVCALLGDSRQGRQATRDLLAFLENGGTDLDEQNQAAIMELLDGSWGAYGVTVREVIRDWL